MLVKDPVYFQLAQELRRSIRLKRLVVGSRFLTEREISARFGVSRTTANKAISSLVAEGVLEFRKGVGTFVRGESLQYDLRALVSFTDKAIAAGKTPSTRVLELATVPASKAEKGVADVLHAKPADPLVKIVRLRLVDDVAVILEHRYVPADRCHGLDNADLTGSLYAIWTDQYGLSIGGADETIRAIGLRLEEAAFLGVKQGSAAMEILSVGYLASGEPLWWERTLYRGDAYELHNYVGPIQPVRPAAGILRAAKRGS